MALHWYGHGKTSLTYLTVCHPFKSIFWLLLFLDYFTGIWSAYGRVDALFMHGLSEGTHRGVREMVRWWRGRGLKNGSRRCMH